MRLQKYQTSLILSLLFLSSILAFPLVSEAYIDPGTGSLVIQGLIASVAVVGVYFKFFGRKIGSLFSYFSKDKKNKDEKTQVDPIDEHKQQSQK